MSLFPLDGIRNAAIDRDLEPVLEDVREDIIAYAGWSSAGLGETADIFEAFDMARPRLNVLISAITARQPRVCVDISTGLGFLPTVLARLGVDTRATERDLTVTPYVQALGIEVREYDIGRTPPPYPLHIADVLVFAEVLEHVKRSPIPVLHDVLGMLRPGGTFLLTTPNIARLAHLEALAAGENFLEMFPDDLALNEDPTEHLEHVREYSVREVVDAVERAGLEIERVTMTGWGVHGYDPLPNPYANDIIVVQAVK